MPKFIKILFKGMPAEKGCGIMVRQCAWCLRLIDGAGERISPSPLPKLYEATHGMCGVCGTLWMEQVLGSESPETQATPPGQSIPLWDKDNVSAATGYSTVERQGAVEVTPPSVTELVLQLQQQAAKTSRPTLPKLKKGPLSII